MNKNIFDFPPMHDRLEQVQQKLLKNGGDGPYDGNMEARITELENFAVATRERLIRIESTMATKTDVSDLRDGLRGEISSLRVEMHKEFTAQSWRIIGAMLTFGTLLSAAVFFIARHVP